VTFNLASVLHMPTRLPLDITPIPDVSQMMPRAQISRILFGISLAKTQKVWSHFLDFYIFCRNNGIY
jgi:hypothetical protein